MQTINHLGQKFLLRTSTEADIPALRKLVNEAYKELSDRGWNYTATYQDEETTRQRIQKVSLPLLLNIRKMVLVLS